MRNTIIAVILGLIFCAPLAAEHYVVLSWPASSTTQGSNCTRVSGASCGTWGLAPGVRVSTGSVGLNQNDLINLMETAPSTPAVMSACSEEID